jgi:hypothetical protein
MLKIKLSEKRYRQSSIRSVLRLSQIPKLLPAATSACASSAQRHSIGLFLSLCKELEKPKGPSTLGQPEKQVPRLTSPIKLNSMWHSVLYLKPESVNGKSRCISVYSRFAWFQPLDN